MASPKNEHPAELRDACARACVDRGLGPMAVVRLAAAGELEPGLAPIAVPPATVSSWASRLRRRRAGDVRTAQSATPAAERIAALRDRLLNACEHELARLERLQRTTRAAPCSACGELTKRAPTEVSGEQLRQIGRALREAAAIMPAPRAASASPSPSATGERPAQPGTRDAGGNVAGGATRGGLAGAILADLAEPAPSPSTSPRSTESDASPHENHEPDTTPATTDEPRSTTNENENTSENASDPVRAAREQVAEHLERLAVAAAGVDVA